MISTLVGAAVASVTTGVATWWTLSAQEKRAKRAQVAQTRALLQSISSEFETVLELYKLAVGNRISGLPDTGPVDLLWIAGSQYFPIYTANAAAIGTLDDHDLRQAVIIAYSRAQGLIDTFRMNNELLLRYDAAHVHHSLAPSDAARLLEQERLSALVLYGPSVRRAHQGLSEAVENALRLLRRHGAV
ncbi:hypothetical protein [Chitinasiproducens palmae]|uniref:Uncharacterized protein n=1 Tax=Chitinasiproducens palmae TaxID=1770053 RepID=A0A1H2PSB1_9BURK|nr:hypothetical protein [Chitinasiproducens palmae]SDV49846.1 hypothetical protein SAMN05216551_109188 [Chitinasiproducens palmae]